MNALIYYLAYPILFLISRLPFPLFYKLSDLVCFILYRVFGYRKSVVRSNIKRAFPSFTDSELMFIERKFYSHLCDLFLEIIKSMGMSKDEMLKRYDNSAFRESITKVMKFTEKLETKLCELFDNGDIKGMEIIELADRG